MEAIDKTILSEQTKLQLSEKIWIENYFIIISIKENHAVKKLNKHLTAFGYIDKVLIVLNTIIGGVSIIWFTSVFGVPIGIVSASFTLHFFKTNGIVKKIIEYDKKQKEKAS